MFDILNIGNFWSQLQESKRHLKMNQIRLDKVKEQCREIDEIARCLISFLRPRRKSAIEDIDMIHIYVNTLFNAPEEFVAKINETKHSLQVSVKKMKAEAPDRIIWQGSLTGDIHWQTFDVEGSFYSTEKNRNAIEKAKQILKEYDLKLSEWEDRLKHIERILHRSDELKPSLDITELINVFPKNYNDFSAEQKNTLATLVSNTQEIGKLINECVC